MQMDYPLSTPRNWHSNNFCDVAKKEPSQQAPPTTVEEALEFDPTNVFDEVGSTQNKGDNYTAASDSTPDTPPQQNTSTSLPVHIFKPSRAMQESIVQKDFYGIKDMYYMDRQSIETLEASLAEWEHDQHLELQGCIPHPIAFHAAKMMGDMMHMHQAIRQPDAHEFIKAMQKEVDAHISKKNWKIVRRNQVPADTDIIPAVWFMQCKQDLTTNTITKYKARLNIHRGNQVYGMNYYEAYAPVVTWYAICLIVTFSILF